MKFDIINYSKTFLIFFKINHLFYYHCQNCKTILYICNAYGKKKKKTIAVKDLR